MSPADRKGAQMKVRKQLNSKHDWIWLFFDVWFSVYIGLMCRIESSNRNSGQQAASRGFLRRKTTHILHLYVIYVMLTLLEYIMRRIRKGGG